MLPEFLSDGNNNKTNLGTTIIKKNYINIERILDELEEMEDMLDIKEEKGEVKEINRFQSVKEVEKARNIFKTTKHNSQ